MNRKIGEKTYASLRLYVPSRDAKLLLKRLQAEGGEDAKLHFTASFHGSRITLTPAQFPTGAKKPAQASVAERAEQIIAMVDQLGGTSTWPAVREKLGLPSTSMPGPFLVKQLRDRGLLTIKNPKTSTMTWKLIDREKLNGWTAH